MKIKQIGDYRGDIVDTVLTNRGVENRDLYFNPDNSTDSNPYKFYKAKDGVELLLNNLGDNAKIAVVVDADADGFMSSALFYSYINDVGNNPNLHYILHDSKAHGLTEKVMEQILTGEYNLVVVPDAGSNDVTQIEKLEKANIKVLIIDHHQVTEFTDKGIIVNNQLCEFTNKNFVGVGVVYKFLQIIDNNFGLEKLDNYLDLVAIGQIGDASNIADNEIRNLVLKGIDNIQNGFLKVAIGQKNGFGPIRLAPKDMSFGVIPIINAVARVGTLEERDILFRALVTPRSDEVFPTVKKKKNKTTGKFDQVTFNFNLYEHAYETTTKCKARQDAAVKKMVASLDESVVDDAGIIIAFTGDNENPGITGLIANKLMSKYDKPVLLLNDVDEVYMGSGRGHEKTLKDFRSWCEASGLIEFAQGHDNAFGFCIRKEKFDDFKEYSRTIEKQEVIYEVDVLSNKPSKEVCEDVDNNKRLFGGTVSEPLIGIKDLVVPKRFISFKGNMMTIYSWGVSIVMFSAPSELVDKIIKYPDDNVKFNIVGTYSVNDWGGRKSPQMVIKDIEVIYKQEEEINVDNIIF